MENIKDTRQTIWIISEIFYPSDISTGYLLTKIALALSPKAFVRVLTATPASGGDSRFDEDFFFSGVQTRRVWTGLSDVSGLLGRATKACIFAASVFIFGLILFRRSDKVLVVTNPPFLPFIVAAAAWLRRAKVYTLVHDLYPEVLFALGVLDRHSPIVRAWEYARRLCFRVSEKIIVIGRDMDRRVREIIGDDAIEKLVLISNWADVGDVYPTHKRPGSFDDDCRYVFQYSGNIGRTHDLLLVVQAYALARNERIRLDLIGDVCKLNRLTNQVDLWPQGEIRIRERCARSQLREVLNSCDAGVISMIPGMGGVSVPSRAYNLFAAGKPILALVDEDSEIGLSIRENNIGWVVPPGDLAALVRVFQEFPGRAASVLKGEQIRNTALKNWSEDGVLSEYVKVLVG